MMLPVLTWAGGAGRAVGPVDMPSSNEPRVWAATCVGKIPLLASRSKGESWKGVQPKQKVYSRDMLVVAPGLRGRLLSRSKGVQLDLWGNLPQLSDSPVLESAVILHDTRAFDLDLTPLRGRIVLTNKKEKGPAKVWLRGLTGVELTLPSPGDKVALELYGRWPAGVPFTLTPKPGHAPIRVWEVHVLNGRLDIKTDTTSWSMAAPPGAAYFHGDSVSGPDRDGPQKRDNLPAWFDKKAPQPPESKVIRGLLNTYLGRYKDKTPLEIGKELMEAAAKEKDQARATMLRQIVVCTRAALDDIASVVDALDYSKHADMRQAAVVSLRHWIGVGPGRDRIVYDILMSDYGYSKPEAETVMQLLHSPFDPEQPETYEALIAYLKHPRLPVRELAYWHLQRLAPAGRDIPYDAAAPQKELDKAVAQWQKLIPSGELPKDPADKGKKE
jgi:hypothetical protein